MSAVVADAVCKSYKDVVAVKDVSLRVEAGELAAVLGPNGAGKTTTIEMFEGHRAPTSGSIRVLGLDPTNRGEFRQLRRRIGVALQRTGYEPTLTVQEIADRQASYYPSRFALPPIIEALGLGAKLTSRIGTLSEGTRRRADIFFALVGAPDVLFLDEPTAGLDPIARRDVQGLLTSLRQSGMAIIMTSHHLNEVHEIADTVHVLRDGTIMMSGPPGTLIRDSGIKTIVAFDRPAAALTLPEGAVISGDRVTFDVDDPSEFLRRLHDWSGTTGIDMTNLTITQPTLDEAYVRLVGGGQ
ncbi:MULTISPECIES: ABC transporter ATP-binding protein [Clavibacter]|uniref:ABC transporter ATP-binding protein n=2 Tax=Clavibacter TaxID=1573 RepID=A0A399NY39_9MICO|nr:MULTISPECIES: ABC transporter ATP-binding protein [Clavibacter]KDP89810.1 hypothetical protein W824_15055 [Clavibacter cf. michiganensis LMG 26808]RII99085.1 ABC transporter ATP-binding protein [Clavibacter michiganensis]UKF26703.1 ABC transporter ATP-binding protein [Clavibacter sp. A6099]